MKVGSREEAVQLLDQEEGITLRRTKKRRMGPQEETFDAQYDIDPGFLKMITSSEFWKRDVGPRAVNAVKGLVSGIPGAPMDLGVLSYHTTRWIAEASRVGPSSYSFLEDYPDMAEIPFSSDWIGEKAFDANVDSPEFGLAGILSPSPGDAAGAVQQATLLGPLMFARVLDDAAENAPAVAQTLEMNSALAREMAENGESVERIWQETGWTNIDGDWKFWLDDRDAAIETMGIADAILAQSEIDPGLFNQMADGAGATVNLRLGDFFSHERFFAIAPEFENIQVTLAAQRVTDSQVARMAEELNPDGSPVVPMVFDINGDKYMLGTNVLSSPGGAFTHASRISEASVQARDIITEEDLISIMAHEVLAHGVQAVEGWARGGSPAEFLAYSMRNGNKAPVADGLDHAKFALVDMYRELATVHGPSIFDQSTDAVRGLLQREYPNFADKFAATSDLSARDADMAMLAEDLFVGDIMTGGNAMIDDLDHLLIEAQDTARIVYGPDASPAALQTYEASRDALQHNMRLVLEAQLGEGGAGAARIREEILDQPEMQLWAYRFYRMLGGEQEARMIQQALTQQGRRQLMEKGPLSLMESGIDFPSANERLAEGATGRISDVREAPTELN